MTKATFKNIEETIIAYNATIDKLEQGISKNSRHSLSEISDDDLYILCLGDTLSVRKNLEKAVQVANSHFEDATSIQNYRKLVGTVDLEALAF